MNTKAIRGLLGLLIITLASLSLIGNAYANLKYEVQTIHGYSNNLFSNSDGKDDRNITNKFNIDYYPLSFAKVNINGSYTYYDETNDLKSASGGIGIDILPISKDKKYAILLSGSFNPTKYREEGEYEKLNSISYDFKAALGYQLSNLLHMRIGASYKNTDYTDEPDLAILDGVSVYAISGDQEEYEFFVGVNYSPFSNFALDMETGFSKMNLSFVEQPTDSFFNPTIPGNDQRDNITPGNDPILDGDITSFYFSPRLSGSLGSKFGFNSTFIYRDFGDVDNIIVPGLSTDAFSPWASVYEGTSFTFTIKTFALPNFIISTGYGFWDKNYLKSERERENRLPGMSPNEIYDREDEQSKFFFAIKRPFPSKGGIFIEPAIQLDITNNESTNIIYDYDTMSINGGLTIRF